jgi:hypothetical protein
MLLNMFSLPELQNKTGAEVPFIRSIETKSLYEPAILASNHQQ